MKFDIVRLNNNILKSIDVDVTYSFTKDELKGTDLLELNNVKVIGTIFKNSLGNIELDLNVKGIMVLPCAITLKPVNYPFDIKIDGELNELMKDFEENKTNFQNTIDILPIIWENILLEIPMRVVSDELESSDVPLEGDGWSFTTNELEKQSPLSELIDMIDDSEVK